MNDPTKEQTILVMDDDEDVRFIAGIMLKRLGFLAEFAETGSEAIRLYQHAMDEGRPYHAVILDLNVPGAMGGLEAVQQLKVIDPEVTAYVSCGNPFDPVMDDPSAFGFKGAINKPILPENLRILLST